jgi:hypothetical protein
MDLVPLGDSIRRTRRSRHLPGPGRCRGGTGRLLVFEAHARVSDHCFRGLVA